MKNIERKQINLFLIIYRWGKKLIDVMPKVKSTDKENRNAMPDNIKIPHLPSNKSDQDYIDKGTDILKKTFQKI